VIACASVTSSVAAFLQPVLHREPQSHSILLQEARRGQ
jgi:hypothetical protein